MSISTSLESHLEVEEDEEVAVPSGCPKVELESVRWCPGLEDILESKDELREGDGARYAVGFVTWAASVAGTSIVTDFRVRDLRCPSGVPVAEELRSSGRKTP